MHRAVDHGAAPSRRLDVGTLTQLADTALREQVSKAHSKHIFSNSTAATSAIASAPAASLGLLPEQTKKLVDEIVERKLETWWKHARITRVLDTGLKAHEQVLIRLYDRAPQTVEELLGDEKCLIIPPGVHEAEAILTKRRGATAP